MSIRLEIGCGDKPRDGWIGVDRKLGSEAFPLSFPDNHADEIMASHVLEHFPYPRVAEVVAEWVRVLKPNGVIKIAVPDLSAICRQYLDGHVVPIQQYLMGGMTDENDRHGALFDRTSLEQIMRKCGLREIETWEGCDGDCSALPISLNLQGRKPSEALPIDEDWRPAKKITACLSMPRISFTDTWFLIAQELKPFGVNIVKSTGAFWGQCLERGMQKAIKDGAEWILTVDYDTIFTANQFRRLCQLFNEHPEADAISCLQIKRGGGGPMFQLQRTDGKTPTTLDLQSISGTELLRCHSAHFGLTLLRVEALQRMPHPWFLGQPNADGMWDDGRIDDDIHFWNKWASVGNSLYLAHRLGLGHMQLMITWPSENMGELAQHTDDYQTHGQPRGARR